MLNGLMSWSSSELKQVWPLHWGCLEDMLHICVLCLCGLGFVSILVTDSTGAWGQTFKATIWGLYLLFNGHSDTGLNSWISMIYSDWFSKNSVNNTCLIGVWQNVLPHHYWKMKKRIAPLTTQPPGHLIEIIDWWLSGWGHTYSPC